MRECKFRGLDCNLEIWRYGSLILRPDPSIFFYDDDNTFNFLVKPETVGQFAGLKDKHQKKLFEGDILSFKWWNDEEEIVECVFESGGFCLKREDFVPTDFSYISLNASVGKMGSFEIIGNLHQNPELLAKG